MEGKFSIIFHLSSARLTFAYLLIWNYYRLLHTICTFQDAESNPEHLHIIGMCNRIREILQYEQNLLLECQIPNSESDHTPVGPTPTPNGARQQIIEMSHTPLPVCGSPNSQANSIAGGAVRPDFELPRLLTPGNSGVASYTLNNPISTQQLMVTTLNLRF